MSFVARAAATMKNENHHQPKIEIRKKLKGETMHKRIWLVAVPLAALSLSGGMAFGTGGTKVGESDGVDAIIGKVDHNFFASGALGTVRSEPDDFTFRTKSIGCWIDSVAGAATVTCMATTDIPNDFGLTSLRCISHDAAMVAAVGAMNSDSMITFETPDATSAGVGTCVHIRVENVSIYNVKAP